MKIDLTGLHTGVTEAIKEFTEKKVEKLAKFFDEATICHVTFSVDKEKQHVDIRIEYKSTTYLANEDCEDLYYGIEKVIEKIESQIRKSKSIIEKKRREGIDEGNTYKLNIDEILNEDK
ncbi:MAG: ribosome-associated translation inhibitor RaiA [Clostridia bacterium]|nr:ribosome-associated translation inhibitor RaiA [Clostridia bacterium]MDD4386221.1 ribosome-associated translation inhibitor RaiA [Clostridia bacterium]